MRQRSHTSSEHRTDEERRSENATSITRRVACSHSNKLQNNQQCHKIKGHFPIQSITDVSVTYSQHLRNKPTQHAYQQSTGNWLEPERLRWHCQKSLS